MREQWLKLHRKILDNPVVMKDADHLAIWIWLLCEAAFKEHDTMFNGKRITLQPGQVPAGRKKIASELHVSESKVQRVLKRFETEHQIEQLTTPHGRLISILNWDEYQSSEQQNEQQVNNKRTTSEQQVNTTEERKKDRKKDIYISVPAEIKDEFMEWVAMRKKLKKPLESEIGVQRALKKLNSLSKNPEKQKELIGYAIYKNWLSFYPIPEEDKIPKPKPKQEEPKPIDAAPMPEETRKKLSELGFGNIIGG